MSSIKVGVIGAGHLGKIHTRLLRTIDGFELVAVADPSPEARAAVSAEYGVRTVAEYRELAGVIQAAVIATPTQAHLETALWCLEQGMHCFVEKPLVRNARHAEMLTQVAQHRQRVLQVGHVERFNPAWQAFRPLAHHPGYLEARRTSTYTGRSTDIGVVFDLMIHDLDLVLDCMDAAVVHVSASGQAVLGRHEDWAEARLQFSNGAVANLFASRISPEPVRSMRVVSSGMTASLDFAKSTCDIVESCDEILEGRFRAEELPDGERRSLHQTLFQRWLPRRSIETRPINAIEMELRDFQQAIASGKPPMVDGVAATKVVEVAERILQAIAAQNQLRHQALAEEEGPAVIPAAHRFGVRRAS